MDALSAVTRESLIVSAILCFPVLAVATLVGTLVAVVQAATQIQEQTLALLPKMVAVGVVLVFGGPFGFHLCAALFTRAVAALPAIVAGP